MLMEINNDNLRMVNGQIKPINGMTEKLVSIFNSLNRESFMPEEFKESLILEYQTISPIDEEELALEFDNENLNKEETSKDDLFEDLIFNVGVRVDRFDANQKVLKDQHLLYSAYVVSDNMDLIN